MIKKSIATIISLSLSVLPMSAIAAGKHGTPKSWDPTDKIGKNKRVKAQRYTTKNGQIILMGADGKRYLMDKKGKHYMVDQNGNKIQVNSAGKIIKMNNQRNIILRLGPGPLA
jgi:hypothetical protein